MANFHLAVYLLLVHIASVVVSLNCSNTYQCVCGDDDDSNDKLFQGVVHCKRHQRNVHVEILKCITYDEKLDDLVAGMCPFSSRLFPLTHHNGRYTLPSKNIASLVNFNADVMCSLMKRSGRNCGRCSKDYSLAINSYFLYCIEKQRCHWYYLPVMFLVNLLPVTILFAVIIIFHIRFSAGYANLFIFWAQIISTQINVMHMNRDWISVLSEYPHTGEKIFMPLVVVYSVWNLDLGHCILPHMCLPADLNNLHSFALQYITAFYGLALIVIVYIMIELHARNFRLIVWLWRPFGMCLSRFQRRLDGRASIIDAFATFLLLAYSKLALTSIMLLTPSDLITRSGETLPDKVLLYDGTTEYFSKKHVPYAIFAIVVLMVFTLLPPIALIMYPFKCVQKCLTRYRLNRPALVAFMDAFQGCYKDGTNGTRDLRFFSAAYLFARLWVFTWYATCDKTGSNYNLLLFVLLVTACCVIILIAILRPYKRNAHNNLDIAMLIFFIIITGANSYILAEFHTANGLSLTHVIIVYILTSLPFLVAVVFILARLCVIFRLSNYIQQCFHSSRRSLTPTLSSGLLINLPPETQPTTFPDRLLRPEEYSHGEVDQHKVKKSYGAALVSQ